ncbi:retroviral-like aspartic protease family protein [Nitrospirillum sp. BR 11163]|uniref:retroviral-like aspartic protease family protein n=1 Tax=Nitrospirillum sp. BR 11163 TaxID=3104323 RepID=UPI002AFF7039|nr:retroviral-like aspartic protease family protein [Nitrospirillum sp. BR 11163]MEA1674199.1 retroviral-like aspartic protease family protein [Nitrospirillum sp. BR 11163]
MVIKAGGLLCLGLAATPAAAEKSKCRPQPLSALPITMDRNMPLIDVGINGQQVHMLLDTGSDTNFITRPAAERLKLRHGWEPGLHAEGVGGHVAMYSSQIDDMTLGNWLVHRVEMPVLSNHDIGDGPDVVGVLGERFLSNFDLDIDIAHNRLTLFHPEDCEHTALASYWGVPYDYTKIERMREDGSPIWLTVMVNGQPVRAVLDTGAETSVLTLQAAERVGMTPQTPGVTHAGKSSGIGNDEVDDYVGLFDSFKLGDEEIRRVRLRFGNMFGHGGWDTPEMLLGLDFLRAHRVFISHSQHRLYFAYVGSGPIFQVVGPRLPRADQEAEAASAETQGR